MLYVFFFRRHLFVLSFRVSLPAIYYCRVHDTRMYQEQAPCLLFLYIVSVLCACVCTQRCMCAEVCLAAHPTMFVCCCFSGKFEIAPLPGVWQAAIGLGPLSRFPSFLPAHPPLSLSLAHRSSFPIFCSGSAVKPLNRITPRPPPFRPPGTTLPFLADGPAPRWLDTVPMGHIAAFYLHRPFFFQPRIPHIHTHTKRLLRGKMWYGNMAKTYMRSFL
jgi:hypothetical protein